MAELGALRGLQSSIRRARVRPDVELGLELVRDGDGVPVRRQGAEPISSGDASIRWRGS
ncbi:MAG: hypothetical protein R3A78_12110 [Polyangiales bacterium]